MPEVLWYYARNQTQFGPVSAGELKQLADSGRLSPEDLLWREGMDAWTTANSLRGLFDGPAPATVAEVPGRPPTAQHAAPPRSQSPEASLEVTLRTVQWLLWGICILVVLVGLVLLTHDFLTAADSAAEAASAAVYATFFIAAYVLARAGESVARLVNDSYRRK